MKIFDFLIFSSLSKNEKTPETLDFTGFSGGVFGVPEVIRTPDLPLRSDLGTPVLRDFLYLKIPYFQGFFVL